MKAIVYFIYLIFILQSCDVPGLLIINNENRNYFKSTMFSHNDQKDFTIELIKGKKHIKNFGFGHKWTDEIIHHYIVDIDSIQLITENDTLLLKDKVCMFNFFKKNRKGLLKKEICIKY